MKAEIERVKSDGTCKGGDKPTASKGKVGMGVGLKENPGDGGT